MSLLDPIFGAPLSSKQDNSDTNPVALIVLFSGAITLEPAQFRRVLQDYAPETSNAEIQIHQNEADTDSIAARVRWGSHIIDMIGFHAPMPKPALETCIAPAHYAQEIKQQAYQHQAHMLLFHRGPEPNPLERYYALSAMSGVLEVMGGSIAVNETGHSSLPAGVFSPRTVADNRMEHIRSVPIPLLYAGLVKYNLPGVKNVWMRTYGADVLGVIDLAMLTEGHHVGQQTMDLFDGILTYLIKQNAVIEAGHTLQLGTNTYVRFRAPASSDPQDGRDGPFLVVEKIAPNEVNQKPSPLQARELTTQELDGMRSAGQHGFFHLTTVTLGSPPDRVVEAIDSFVKDWQKAQRNPLSKLLGRAPKQDPKEVARNLGAVWGNQLVSQFQWKWVYISKDASQSYAVASPDESVAIYPTQTLTHCLSHAGSDCAVLTSYQMIASGRLPEFPANSYANLIR